MTCILTFLFYSRLHSFATQNSIPLIFSMELPIIILHLLSFSLAFSLSFHSSIFNDIVYFHFSFHFRFHCLVTEACIHPLFTVTLFSLLPSLSFSTLISKVNHFQRWISAVRKLGRLVIAIRETIRITLGHFSDSAASSYPRVVSRDLISAPNKNFISQHVIQPSSIQSRHP